MTETGAQSPRPKRRTVVWIAASIWLCAIVAVFAGINIYAETPSPAGTPPRHWPAQSRIVLDPVNPTLILFAHPHCPCTRATIGELEKIMASCQGRLRTYVLFVRPDQTPIDWEKTDLWTSAAAIPGVTVKVDPSGVETQRFHIETSGDALVYDSGGNLLFHGGITIARGHAGDSAGDSGILAIVNHQIAGGIVTPAFGCSLLGDACRK